MIVLYDTRGPVTAANTIKLCRLALTRYLAGQALKSARIGLTADGLPKMIPHPWRENIRAGCPRTISASLTLLTMSRLILGGSPVDLEAIESPSGASSQALSLVTKYLDRFLQHYQIEPIDTTWKSFHWSSKAAPSGPALVSALRSWKLLPDWLKRDHITIAGDKLKSIYEDYSRYQKLFGLLSELFPIKRNLIRKLSVKDDKEAKSRVFAQLDYYSQSVLYPIHKGLFQGLKRIPSDRTFVHATGLDLGQPTSSFHSLDLSSATDRFPLKLQVELMRKLIGDAKAEAWARILTDLPYDYQGKPVFYRAGQPMGAYSSWAAFTMTHHLLVFAAASEVGKSDFSAYALLGDDIVIADDAVATKYRELLRDLDVPISDAKTHTSKDVYEFAKRWFFKGREVSPFPISALPETIKKYYLLVELFRGMQLRGFETMSGSSKPNRFLPSLLRIWGYKGRRLRQYIFKFTLTSIIPLAGSDTLEVYYKALAFSQLTGCHLSCNSGVTSVARFFGQLAARTAAWIMDREASRARNKASDWAMKATSTALSTAMELTPKPPKDYDELSDVEQLLVIGSQPAETGPDGQPELPEDFLTNSHVFLRTRLPVLDSLFQKSDQALVASRQEFSEYSDIEDIWDKASRMTLLQIPDVSGINPTRSSHQIAGARATWALNLARVWKLHEQGERPK